MKVSVYHPILLSGWLAMAASLDAAEPAESLDKAPGVAHAATMEALVAEVLERNPELNFYTAEIAAAKGERRTAAMLSNPEMSAQLGGKTVRGGGTSDEGIAWSVSAQQAFEWPGRIPLRKAIANRQIKLAELGKAQFHATLAGKARTAAYALFAAQEKAAVAAEVADRLQALREVLVQREPAGLTPVLEARIIEATEITLHRRASEQALEEKSALLELNQLRGQAWDAPLRVTGAHVTFPGPLALNDLLAAARTNNFELQMRQAELEQQGFRVALARNERYPSVSAGPFFSQERAGERENIAGIGVTVPLPLWNRNQGNIETARAREAQAQTSLYIAQREIERKVVEQTLRYQTKLNEMAKWRPDSIEQFREAARLADRHYRLSAVPLTTYVELQKQYLDAVEALLDTKREALDALSQAQWLTGIEFKSAPEPEVKQ